MSNDKDNNPKKKMKYNYDSLNSFMNSAINIEYVYLIILGLN